MKARKIISLLTIMTIMVSVIGVFGAHAANQDSEVTLIVEVNGDAALETAEAVLMGASKYNETDASARHTSSIMSVQESVEANIKSKVNRYADVGFTYTNVLNGFSVTVQKSDIEKIKALPNVKNVYIAGTHKYIEPIENDETASLFDDTEASSSDNCCQMINVPYMHELGYKGQGQAIAVIDSELDVNHEFFTSPIESPKYSKADIAKLISEKNLNVDVSANRVWRSDKIPFAYSYAKNNADVYDTFLVHGSHVCGIAAGKDGTRKDGTKFSGVAPEAQIIFMGVLKDSENLPDDAIIAAIDDASKMDIAAINMSLGADYTLCGNGLDVLFDRVINNAVNAGIEVCVASGNAGKKADVPENIDYSTSGLPASASGSTSVAAAWGSDGSICYFSSWGTGTTLELKPEITTPGGSIYSSIPDDKYATYSGTSMATPHMTGAAALMRQYIEANYQGKYDNPAQFIENLTMTGAKVMSEDEAEQMPYSPRNQGSGMIDLKAAATTPVILLGDSGKTKISLKDELTDTFHIEFTARNFTDTDVVYDTVTPFVLTDNHKLDAVSNREIIYKIRKLKFTATDIPESVTVPANGETKINITINLDSEETAENLKVFTNGFYLDGFVELSDSGNAVPAISIPYTGFYGDWTAAPALDKPYYQEGSEKNTFLASSKQGGCVCCNIDGITKKLCSPLGINRVMYDMYDTELKDISLSPEYRSESYAGISPNGDGLYDYLCVSVIPYRQMENCAVRIENSLGEVIDAKASSNAKDDFAILENADGAPSDKYDKKLVSCTDYNDLSEFPDGDYTVYLSGRLPYEGAKDEEVSMKFYIDTVAPKITEKKIREEGDKTYLDLSMSDNRYVMGAIAEGKKTDGGDFKNSMYTKAGKTGECSIDITDADISTLKVTALDYAYNQFECDAAGGITVTMPGPPVFNGNATDISFDILNETYKTATADIIAAVYGENDILAAVFVNRGETIPEGESTQTFSFQGDLSGKTVKVMIFDSLEGIKPLGQGESFTI